MYRRIITVVLGILLIATFAFAETKEIKDAQGNVIEYQITIKLTPEEYKAFSVIAYDPEEWIQNRAYDRARKAIDDLVTKSGKGSQYTDKAKKYQIIREMKVKTAKERQKEFEAEMLKK